jgi:hypothetical protein
MKTTNVRPGLQPDREASWTAAASCRFHSGRRNSGRRGILLIECVFYMGLFFLVVGIAFKLFYSCWDSAKAFRRTTDQIANAIRTGDRWREDVRTATAPLRAEDSPEGPVLRIPHGAGEIDYMFSTAALWRRAGGTGDWTQVLPDIKSSRMAADQRRQLTAWRWELELATHRQGARVVPLFTFEAVPKTLSNP